MLKVTINYSGKKMLYQCLTTLNFKFENSEYNLGLSLRAGGPLRLFHEPAKNRIQLTFPNEVTMEDCVKINGVINTLSKTIDGDVDDSKAHLGYDKNSNKIYIFNGFHNWAEFIDEAKHKSMEGQKVAIKHGGNTLGEGIMLTFNKSSSDNNSKITNCTLITKSGEQSFYGDDLKVLPITSW